MKAQAPLYALAALALTVATPLAGAAAKDCTRNLAAEIPARAPDAPVGTAVMARLNGVRGSDRDAALADQLLSGNVPSFLRELIPVTFTGTAGGKAVRVTICVMPDYLAVGSNRNFVRTPLGLPTAARIALKLGFFLPTTRMVDAIYAQAKIHLAPRPMPASAQMTSTAYLVKHNATVDAQLGPQAGVPDELVAGQKKDLVLSNRLRKAPGKVAIYGWQKPNGRPIQPLSTVHQAVYADYSHGIRLIGATAFVNDRPEPLAQVMQDPSLARLVSSEGPIPHPMALLASVAN